jgi:hypothetical protein
MGEVCAGCGESLDEGVIVVTHGSDGWQSSHADCVSASAA